MPSPNKSGFTFIEVLIAMAIFTMAVLAAVSITGGSVQATRDAREISIATWLLQKKMVELETKLETDGIDKACEKKDEGKFEEPYQTYTWKSFCDEVDFKISETAAKMAQSEEGEESGDTSENQILKLILNTASDYITQSVREVHVEVDWQSGKAKRSVDASTHFVRYDQKVALGGGGTSKSTETTPTTGGDKSGGDTTQ
jgi:type II secretion system protein I